MLAQTVFFYIFLFLILFPILIAGTIFLKKASSLNRFELLFPVGSILGIAVFIFLLNSVAFFINGFNGIVLAYLLLIFFALILFDKQDFLNIVFPKNRRLVLFVIGFIFWGAFIAWKGSVALIGSDTNLYYAVAHTFVKGNFPPMTPWQPDLELSYHLGVFELLGAFFAITGLSFTFLHIFFSSFFIFLLSQIIIWFWKSHASFYSFFWGNLAAAVVLISFGFFKFVIPIFPFSMQSMSSFHQFFLWIRGLPTVNESIEVYGAPINLDALIYFIFHPLGLVLFLSLLVLVVHPGKKVVIEWIILMICGVALSIINESVFIVTFPSLVLFKLIIDFQQKRLPELRKLILIFFVALVTLFYQNEFISSNLFSNNKIKPSVLIFPKKEQVKEDFKSYHYYQQISKHHQDRVEWLPFSWNHIGLEFLLILSVLLMIIVKLSQEQRIISTVLLTSSVCSILAYNFIVPKFLVANGNRFLAFAFIFLAALITHLLCSLSEDLRERRNKFLFLVLIFISVWVFVPTIIPPLVQLSKNRFGENKLIPKREQINESMIWMKDNLPYSSRVMVLDIRAPHPSGVARSLTQAGVFSPIFPGDFRAYTIEASPEYFDIAYYLSPGSLRKLKIENLVVDSSFFNTLPVLKQEQLEDQTLFKNIFSQTFGDGSWEKIFKIMPEYFELGETKGTINQLVQENNFSGKIYIDSEENFVPSYLRRALIFSLREGNLYYLPQSGVYLNVETDINWSDPRGYKDYKYLVLSKDTNPDEICECKTTLIWKGVRDEVYVWQRQD